MYNPGVATYKTPAAFSVGQASPPQPYGVQQGVVTMGVVSTSDMELKKAWRSCGIAAWMVCLMIASVLALIISVFSFLPGLAAALIGIVCASIYVCGCCNCGKIINQVIACLWLEVIITIFALVSIILTSLWYGSAIQAIHDCKSKDDKTGTTNQGFLISDVCTQEMENVIIALLVVFDTVFIFLIISSIALVVLTAKVYNAGKGSNATY